MGNSFAQTAKEIKTMEHEAYKLYHHEKYVEALPIYLILDSLKPNDPTIKFRTGVCYLYSPTRYKSLPYLEKANSLNYSREELEYSLGRAYHLNHQFDKAIELYQKCLPRSKDKEKKDIQRLIEMCHNGKKLMADPVNATIQNMGNIVNSGFSEYAPVISADEDILVFTSRRPSTTGGMRDINGEYFEDILISYKENGNWTPPVSIGRQINTPYNDASIALSVDGNNLFVYKNDTITGNGDIYVSERKGVQWTRPKNLGKEINSPYWEPSASLIADENTIFFTSDRPGGYGGTDIYVSRKQKDGKWGVPKNLGPNVNTPYDEEAPFIHADSRTLYFSSQGHNSMGGYDVFTCSFFHENDSVSLPENVGYPINTADDELFFVWSADGTRGYFSAVREDSYGERDIYIVNRPDVKVNLILFSGKISTKDKKHLPAKIMIFDNETNELVALYDSTKFHDDYTIVLHPGKNYGVAIEANGYLSYSENVNIPVHGFHEFNKDIALTPIEKGGLIVLNNVFFDEGKSELKKESYGELDRYLKLIKENPDLALEIAGHAFDFDNHKANLDLSQKRAQAVVDYLISKGVSPEKLRAVGYGDRIKLVDDDSPEGKKANTRTEFIILEKLKEGEKLGKTNGFYNDKGKVVKERIASKTLVDEKVEKTKEEYLYKKDKDVFLGVTDPSGTVATNKEVKAKVEKGQLMPVILKGTITENTGKNAVPTSKIQLINESGTVVQEIQSATDGTFSFTFYDTEEKKYTVSASRSGYSFNSKNVNIPANSNQKSVINVNIALQKLDVGTRQVLRNLYFGFDKISLRAESYDELKKLVTLMKENPKMVVEIAGHTDNIGSTTYNKLLSYKRAESVMNYLIKQGIERSRLTAKGYGEEKPLATNDDEEEGRELNRRTEFVITDLSKQAMR
ncbi:MAG: OmpA family protein [Cytophagaceae bacterium]